MVDNNGGNYAPTLIASFSGLLFGAKVSGKPDYCCPVKKRRMLTTISCGILVPLEMQICPLAPTGRVFKI